MGLNLSNSRIAYELDPDTSDVQQMTEQLRQGVDVTVGKGLVGEGLLRKRNHPYLG
uniref:Uncharacterized protein n=2 Tax=Candidatus Kentrum eta TaxID=2126337 RepID=A0A450V5X1_9GAMM|nr:MAG: hypothetical protein BECKH772A_GA0070896_101861 [Candidatus Kentron sp. H]VFK04247.1 MAG: hypothetical protein BECKH772C_GA0070978_101702 [Candidatus Kentron sp. H]VFK05755.1 MAG: hypothetical protein BECKH772A_GA0070896_105882 [Candidatus Kentron sp. H]VFK05980.1 MAG: hypothetical protein BECKH772B_GA0070898_106383 [Candidatus Kentron sp. H]